MKAGRLLVTSYPAIDAYRGTAEVRSELVENEFLVVTEKGEYAGILTPDDLAKAPYNLVLDCLSPKPPISREEPLETVLERMDVAHTSVLPVFEGSRFQGVIRRRDIADFLVEYREELTGEIRAKTARLQELKQKLEQNEARLEQRVAEETAIRMEQERIIVQQAKLADMGELMQRIAHQWRQPLNVIALLTQDNLELAHEPVPELDAMDENSAKIMEKVEEMSALITKLGGFFRMDREKSRFFPAEVVKETLEIFRNDYLDRPLSITTDLDNAIWIDGYPREYAHVVFNLLKNGVEATEGGTAPGRIGICLRKEEGRSLLLVTDNGGGMAPEVMEKIFEPYFTTRFESQGKGLGLYAVKVIVEKRMEGKLTIENMGDGVRASVLV